MEYCPIVKNGAEEIELVTCNVLCLIETALLALVNEFQDVPLVRRLTSAYSWTFPTMAQGAKSVLEGDGFVISSRC